MMIENQLRVTVSGMNSAKWEVTTSRVINPPNPEDDTKLRNLMFGGVRGIENISKVTVGDGKHTVTITPVLFTKLGGTWEVKNGNNVSEHARCDTFHYATMDELDDKGVKTGKLIPDHRKPESIDLRVDFYEVTRDSASLINPAYAAKSSGGGRLGDDKVAKVAKLWMETSFDISTIATVLDIGIANVSKIVASLPARA